jgi:hypothetical protein
VARRSRAQQQRVLDSDPSATARDKLRLDAEQVVGTEAERVLGPILWTVGLELPGGLSTGEVARPLEEAGGDTSPVLRSPGGEAAVVLFTRDLACT